MTKKSRFYVRSPKGDDLFGFDKMEAAEVAAIEYGNDAMVIDTEARMYEPMLQKVMDGTLVYFGVSGWNTDKKSEEANLVEGIKNGQVAIVQAYFARGANLTATDQNGGTPLHWATASGKVDIAKFLLENGANPDAADNDGDTPTNLGLNSKNTDMRALFTKK